MFLFGSIKMDIKLVPDNSAGTVTAYYVSISLKFTQISTHSVSVLSIFLLIDAHEMNTASIRQKCNLLYSNLIQGNQDFLSEMFSFGRGTLGQWVGSWLFCIQNFPCSVSFQCMAEASVDKEHFTSVH